MGKNSQSIEDAGFSNDQKMPTEKQSSINRAVRNASSIATFSFWEDAKKFLMPLRATENAVHGVPKWMKAHNPEIIKLSKKFCELRRVKS